MKSMTGYGRGQAAGAGYDVTVEISSVNRKTLDVSVSLPRDWTMLEHDLTEQLRPVVARGAVRIAVAIDRKSVPEGLNVDETLVHHTLDKLADLARARGIRVPMDYETLLRVVLMHQESGNTGARSGEETVQPLVQSAMEEALAAFVAMREREGGAIEKDMLDRNESLLDLVFVIRKQSEGTVEAYRDALLARLRQLGLELSLDDERLLKELALFADRADITEELTRLESHLAQFRTTVLAVRGENTPVGRKLEFLIQEINREFNTIGSKANKLEITRCVLDAKNEIERQREQVQNVE